MNLTARGKTGVWSTVAAAGCILALLALWSTALAAKPTRYDGGDAPSSHNHGGLTMYTYDPQAGGVQASFPVVWDYDSKLGPGQTTGYWGFCHYQSGNSSFLGTMPSWERDADKPPDPDGVTNIAPPTFPDRDGSDDGVTFPELFHHCVTETVHIEGQNSSAGTLYLNAWLDWNRDGDWEDSNVSGCGWAQVNEWAIQDHALAPGSFALDVAVLPAHPRGDETEPLWARVTLGELQIGAQSPSSPWSYGGQPHAATGGCFSHGESEDYLVGPEEPECLWNKQVSINDQYAGQPADGPFGVVAGDTVVITDELSCNFPYGWDLGEAWDPTVLSLLGTLPSQGQVFTGTGELDWYGGDPSPVAEDIWVSLTKSWQVGDLAGSPGTTITETVSFIGDTVQPMTTTVELRPVECTWDKLIWLNFGQPGQLGPFAPEDGPFSVFISDTVTISEALSCNFGFTWGLTESWDPDALFLAEPPQYASGTVTTLPGYLDWSGTSLTADWPLTMSKTLRVDSLPGLASTVLTETLDLGTTSSQLPLRQRPVVLKPFQVYVPLVMKGF